MTVEHSTIRALGRETGMHRQRIRLLIEIHRIKTRKIGTAIAIEGSELQRLRSVISAEMSARRAAQSA